MCQIYSVMIAVVDTCTAQLNCKIHKEKGNKPTLNEPINRYRDPCRILLAWNVIPHSQRLQNRCSCFLKIEHRILGDTTIVHQLRPDIWVGFQYIKHHKNL